MSSQKLSNNRILEYLEGIFDVSAPQIKRIAADFRREMEEGLAGRKSSLKMIPTYVDKPCGKEKGEFIALDLGGTNLRILQVRLKGNGRLMVLKERKFVLPLRCTRGRQEDFFGFIAGCLKSFTGSLRADKRGLFSLGFTFSFPVKQTGVSSGILLHWTKDFSVKGAENKEVVSLLRDSLAKKGLNNIEIAALVNDTVGTLVARSYADPGCDLGVILGTGTNACYRERTRKIQKLKLLQAAQESMIINTEWGNFNKLKLNPYDIELDKVSANPGQQILEKMVSGMYLPEIVRLVIKDISKKKPLFAKNRPLFLNTPGSIKTQDLSEIEADSSGRLSKAGAILYRLGVRNSSPEERILIKEICRSVSRRAARLGAAALAGIITKVDKHLSKRHTVAVDGSLYEKHPAYAKDMMQALKEIFGQKALNIKLSLTKDGSGIGAAITAAAAACQK